MWSCGVVLYAMTMAALPFNGPTEADIVDQIALGSKNYWWYVSALTCSPRVGDYAPLGHDLSPAARDIVPQLLNVDGRIYLPDCQLNLAIFFRSTPSPYGSFYSQSPRPRSRCTATRTQRSLVS